jgi:hypothetical protein
MTDQVTDFAALGAIFPACRRCGRALYKVSGGGGSTAHIEQDDAAVRCEQQGVDELVADFFASGEADRG